MENSNIMSDSSGFPPTKSNLAGLPNRMQKVRDIKEKLASFFPPDFISEYTGQIRAWFYVLHVISTAIYDTNAFKNVLVSGVILGTDGRKMSKNYKNYPDPKEVIEKYGGDALRLYLLGSPITKAEDIKISEAEYRDQLRLFIIPLLNIWNFVEMYSKTDGFDTNLKSFDLDIADFDNWNVLDKWLLTRLNTTIADVTEHLENFDTMSVVKTIIQFVDDWSRWHLRRSRDRIGAGDLEKDGEEFYKVTLHVFEKFLRLIAPIVPFHAEYLYKKITGKESVHLEKWPELIPDFNHDILETNMQITREICEIGHQIRKSNNQKVRTPLISLDVKIDKDVSKIHSNMWEVVLSELNIKNIVINNSFRYPEKEVIFTSEELEKEGRVRDLIREVQAIRKNIGLQVSDSIRLKAPVKDIELLTSLKKKLRITEILEGDKIEVAG
ncbi:MAG: class I tRNA ligase family protein [Patescibacteria group bacterium]